MTDKKSDGSTDQPCDDKTVKVLSLALQIRSKERQAQQAMVDGETDRVDRLESKADELQDELDTLRNSLTDEETARLEHALSNLQHRNGEPATNDS